MHNVTFAFELMQDGGLQKPKARPEGTKKTASNVTSALYTQPSDIITDQLIVCTCSQSYPHYPLDGDVPQSMQHTVLPLITLTEHTVFLHNDS